MSIEDNNLDLSLSSSDFSFESDQSQLYSPVHDNQLQILSETQDSYKKIVPFYNFFEPNYNKHFTFVIIYNTHLPFYNFFETLVELEPEPLTTQPMGSVPQEPEIEPVYPWTKLIATEVHTLEYLLSKNINMISGQVMCKNCRKITRLEYNLVEKFVEVSNYIKENIKQLRHRASEEWLKPRLGICDECGTATLRPVISVKKEEINWLFLVLGQMVGCCSLGELRYFCDNHEKHRTGAKDRVVYSTYILICDQLDPTLGFDQ